jgi:transcriptional regulator with XRE-family HTH domain
MKTRISASHKLNFCGPNVRRLRLEKEWSQEQLAGKCQLHGWDASRDIIARLELRNRLVTDWEIIALAKALGRKAGELLE